MKTRKITVKLWDTLKLELDRAMDRACLRRDAYLERLLATELPHLESEVKTTNSMEAFRYIAGRLGDPRKRRTQVTLALQEELVTRLDALCAKRRLSRDAVFNRIIFLLTAPAQTIDINFFDGDSSWRTEVWSECKHDGPFFSAVFRPLDGDVDPFWPIRAGLELRREQGSDIEGIYEATLSMTRRVGRKIEAELLMGLSCTLPDVAVPRSAAAKEFDAEFGHLLRRGSESRGVRS